jgi:hypothetical protein
MVITKGQAVNYCRSGGEEFDAWYSIVIECVIEKEG